MKKKTELQIITKANRLTTELLELVNLARKSKDEKTMPIVMEHISIAMELIRSAKDKIKQ